MRIGSSTSLVCCQVGDPDFSTPDHIVARSPSGGSKKSALPQKNFGMICSAASDLNSIQRIANRAGGCLVDTSPLLEVCQLTETDG